MGLLDSRIVYSKTWEEVSREPFSEADLKAIDKIKVVPANWGKSARLSIGNGYCFYSLSQECQDIPVDTILNKEDCMIVHLERGDQKTDKLLYLGEY